MLKKTFPIFLTVFILVGCTAPRTFTRITEKGVITWDEESGIKVTPISQIDQRLVKEIMDGGIVEMTNTGIDTAGGPRSTFTALTNKDGTTRGQTGDGGRSTLQGVTEGVVPALIYGGSMVGGAAVLRPATSRVLNSITGGNSTGGSAAGGVGGIGNGGAGGVGNGGQGGSSAATSTSASESNSSAISNSTANSTADSHNVTHGGNVNGGVHDGNDGNINGGIHNIDHDNHSNHNHHNNYEIN